MLFSTARAVQSTCGDNMNKIKENPSSVLIIASLLLCCVLTAIPLLRWMRGIVNFVPPTPLSEVVLKPEDLSPGLFVQTGRTSNCQSYLFIPSQSDNIDHPPIDCYQVKFSTHDNSVTLLNAVWLFDSPDKADFEINRFAELIPAANNIDIQIIAVPIAVGNKSAASSAIVTGGATPIYVTNLYWRSGSAVLRLTVLSYQSPVSLSELIMPAQRIETRLESR